MGAWPGEALDVTETAGNALLSSDLGEVVIYHICNFATFSFAVLIIFVISVAFVYT